MSSTPTSIRRDQRSCHGGRQWPGGSNPSGLEPTLADSATLVTSGFVLPNIGIPVTFPQSGWRDSNPYTVGLEGSGLVPDAQVWRDRRVRAPPGRFPERRFEAPSNVVRTIRPIITFGPTRRFDRHDCHPSRILQTLGAVGPTRDEATHFAGKGGRLNHTAMLLVDRVARLDRCDSRAMPTQILQADVERFIDVLSVVTSQGDPREGLPAVSPLTADRIVRESALLERLGWARPESTVGPLDFSGQRWISARRFEDPETPRRSLEMESFVEEVDCHDVNPRSKPSQFGLFSSTCWPDSHGMWWEYLRRNRGSTLFPGPYEIYGLVPSSDARVLEISSATDWEDFVLERPSLHRGFFYPDWRAAAERWDGVHMTARAIATTQGVCLEGRGAPIAPPYWDVESTFWLRWIFRAVRCVDTVETDEL